MDQRSHHDGNRRRNWLLTAIALSATIPLAAALPATAQEEIDPMTAMRIAFDACIASGVDGADCAAAATLTLQAIMSGEPIPGSAEPTPEPGTAGSQLTGSSGQDGQTSNGGDQALSEDTPVEPAPAGEVAPAPAETTPVPLIESMAPPPVEDTIAPPVAGTTPPVETAPPAGTITSTSTTTETGTTNESASTLSGGAQTNDASGTDGGRRRSRD